MLTLCSHIETRTPIERTEVSIKSGGCDPRSVIFIVNFHCAPGYGIIEKTELRAPASAFFNKSSGLPDTLTMLLLAHAPRGFEPRTDEMVSYFHMKAGSKMPTGGHSYLLFCETNKLSFRYNGHHYYKADGNELIDLYLMIFETWEAFWRSESI